MKFNSWEEAFASVLKDDPNLFYIIKFPTEDDRSRFMTKTETLSYIKDKITSGSKV